MNQTAGLAQNTRIEKDSIDWFLFVRRFFLTHWYLFKRPALFANKNDELPKYIIKPISFVSINFLIFLLLVSFFPLFTEPNSKIILGQTIKEMLDFFKTHSYKEILLNNLQYIISCIIGLLLIVPLSLGNRKNERFYMWGISGYILVTILNYIILRWFLGLLIITFLTFFGWFIPLLDWRINDIRFLDIILAVLIYPAWVIINCVSKSAKSRIYLFIPLYLTVVMGVGFYLARGNSSLINQPISLPPMTVPDTTTKKSDTTNAARIPMKSVTTPVENITGPTVEFPDNNNIYIKAVSSDSIIHFKAYYVKNKYWLTTTYKIINSTNTTIDFPNKAKLNLDLGFEALLTQNRPQSKHHWFTLLFAKNEPHKLEANNTQIIRLKYAISKRMYKYLVSECNKKKEVDHKVFIEFIMEANAYTFPVNRRMYWDIRFHK